MTTSVALTPEQVQERLQGSSFNAFLNLEVIHADAAAGSLIVHAPMRPEFERGAGSGQWHGGPLAALVDTVGDFSLIQPLGRGLPTVNFRTVKANVRRAGKSVGVVDIEVLSEAERLLVLGRATYSTLP